MKTFSFLLPDSFRIDIKASYPKAGYNKLIKQGKPIYRVYQEYNKDFD